MQQMTLREARKAKGWSLDELGRRCSVHKSTLSRWENGKAEPTHRAVVAVEQALGLPPGTLVFAVEQVA